MLSPSFNRFTGDMNLLGRRPESTSGAIKRRIGSKPGRLNMNERQGKRTSIGGTDLESLSGRKQNQNFSLNKSQQDPLMMNFARGHLNTPLKKTPSLYAHGNRRQKNHITEDGRHNLLA